MREYDFFNQILFSSNFVYDIILYKIAHGRSFLCPNIYSESINKYAKLLGELDHMTKRMVFESYGVEMQGCECMIESSDYLLRCMKYRTPETDEKDLVMPSHTDLTIVSIVHQLNNLNGLEIKLKDGEWIGVDASSSLFLVVVGDAFHVSTHIYINPSYGYLLQYHIILDNYNIFITFVIEYLSPSSYKMR